MPGRIAAGVAMVAALAALLWGCSRGPEKRSDAEVVVAEVDGTLIVLSEVKREILSMRGYTPSLEAKGPTRAEVAEAMRMLIERAIVLREGERRGVTVSDAALEEEMMRIRGDFPPGGLEKALLQVGMDTGMWRERLRGSLLYRKSAEAIAAPLVTVTPQEVQAAFRRMGKPGTRPERIRVRQYLFDSAELASSAREALAGGGSPDGSGDVEIPGVDLGFFSREELPPELPADLFRLMEGEVSAPVPREGTVSLFQVTEREAAGPQTLSTEETRIREELLVPRREEAFRRWLSEAAARSSVKVRAELLEKLAEGKT
ncbi:MAG TPA: peptidylprolyl isomerase [Candidatus Deferrimicrobiaceae bacterium]